MTMKYHGDCPASNIEVYYAGVHDDYPVLCSFSDISPGDTITCSSTPYDTFRDSTFIAVQYDPHCNPQSVSSDSSESSHRRRLIRVRDDRNQSSSDDSYRGSRDNVDPSEDTESQYSIDNLTEYHFVHFGDDNHGDDDHVDDHNQKASDSDSGDSEDSETSEGTKHSDNSEDSTDSSAGGQCIAKFRTYCSRSVVGSRSEGCDDLQMISYVDGAGYECDEGTLGGYTRDVDSDSDDSTYNAVASGQGISAPQSPIEWIKGLDPFTRYTLLAIMVTSVALMGVACYICVYVNFQKGRGSNDDKIAGRAPSVEIEPVVARRDSKGDNSRRDSIRSERSDRSSRSRRESRSERRYKDRISSKVRMRGKGRERVRTCSNCSYDNVPLEMVDGDPDPEFEDQHIEHHSFVSQRDGYHGHITRMSGNSIPMPMTTMGMQHLGIHHLSALEEDDFISSDALGFNSDAHSGLEYTATETDVVEAGGIVTGPPGVTSTAK